MELDKNVRQYIRKHLGFSDEDMGQFEKDPRNMELISKAVALSDKRIILEVVDSHGCNSQHKLGDRFYFDTFGNLLTESCPKRVCGYSLNSALMMIFTASEMMFAGHDPNQIRFKRSGCFDVGLACGGWGRIVLELRVENK